MTNEALDNVADHECTEVLTDIVLRATCFDFMIDTKLLTKAQITKVLREKEDIRDKVDVNLPVAIGLVLYSMQDLDEKQRAEFTKEHIEAAEEFLRDLEGRGLKRSKKLGPFSHPILD